jgi:hypothetical protein
MSGQRISVEVDASGRVQARRWEDDAHSPADQVGWSGLDAELVRLFERWLTLRDRTWREDEIRAFGMLLHRCLFPDRVWSWVEAALDGEGPVRLALSFPAEPPYSRLAAIPWEYLHTPEQPGKRGVYLAYEPGVVLSRYIPMQAGVGTLATESTVKVLAVVSQPDDPRLGEVVAEPVLKTMQALDPARYRVTVSHNPTARELVEVLADERPHLVHFMGHGDFDPERGQGSLALSRSGGGTEWVDDRRLADLLRRSQPVPRVVVLHSCDGARTDFAASFAGLAPQLVRGGVQCVVAMQYAVTNETATEFSTGFYQELERGRPLDEAVQECRWRIGGQLREDPKLVGVPVVYLHSRDALLGPAAVPPSEGQTS